MNRLKRERDEEGDNDSSPSGFFRKLKRWREMNMTELFKMNQPTLDKCKTANEIEGMVIRMEQGIARVNEVYSSDHGTVTVFGSNENCVLGLPQKKSDEDGEPRPPTKAPVAKRVRTISAGGLHTVALTVDGDVYSWGVPDEGALGYMLSNDEEDMRQGAPQKVPGLSDILQVKAGDSQTLFLNTKGQVLMCGMIRSSNDEKYHYPPAGKSCKGSNATPVPIKMPGNKKAVRIETGNGSNFAAVLLEDGYLVTFGFGEQGELARTLDMFGPPPEGGYNFVGMLETMSEDDIIRKFLTPNYARFAGPIPFPYSRKKVVSVACGSNHLLVLAEDQSDATPTLYSSGQNSSGQLGLPKEIESVHELTFVRENVGLIAAGTYHSYVVDVDGHLMYACGQNSYAQLGLGHDKSPQYGLQQVAFQEPVLLTKIMAGGSHGMALDADNTLYTWGFGVMGATGHSCDARGDEDGDIFRPTKLNLGSSKRIIDFGGGGQHSVVVLSENDHEVD